MWAAYGAIYFAATAPTAGPDEVDAIAGLAALRAVIGFGISFPLSGLCRRILRWRWPGLATALTAAAGAYALSGTWMLIDRVVQSYLMTGSWNVLAIRWPGFPGGVDLDYTLVLMAAAAVHVAAWHTREAARLQQTALEDRVAAHDARLQALTAQLSPHFVLNSLSVLRGVIAEDTTKARAMVTELATYMRITMSAADMHTLGDEVALTDAYLAIARVRFEQALDAEFDIADEAVSLLVPALLLQPLVENALKHGIAVGGDTRALRVLATVVERRLCIEVRSPGRLGSEDVIAEGTGTRNTRLRLAHVYGASQAFTLTEERGWVVARVVIDEPTHAT